MLWCNDFRIYIPLVTSCAKRAVPVRVPDRIVRVAASHTVIATVIEVAEAPPSTETRGGRFAVEAGLLNHHSTLFVSCTKNDEGLAAPLVQRTIHPAVTRQCQVRQESRSSPRSRPNRPSSGKPHRHCHRHRGSRSTTQHGDQRGTVRSRSRPYSRLHCRLPERQWATRCLHSRYPRYTASANRS